MKTNRRQELALAAFGAVAAALLFTWPLCLEGAHAVLRAAYHWDAYTNAMILGCRVDSIVRGAPLTFYENYYFAPIERTIIFNENHFGLALVFAPFYLFSHDPLLAYNWTLLSSLALSVVFAFLLVRRITGSALSGFLAGIGFAFCPYVFFELGRIQLVATQWIPACFFFLHRAFDERRTRDIAALWCVYVLQIGTCLYYAMFLVPLLAVATAVLGIVRRPGWRFAAWFGGLGAAGGAVALVLVGPYFRARRAFDLERSLEFASGYDGELSFLTHVHPLNRTLTSLHHVAQARGAHEEIAFPGVIIAALAALAVVVAAVRWVRAEPWRQIRLGLARVSVALTLSAAAVWSSHDLLPGLVVLLGFAALWWRRKPSSRAQLHLLLYVALLIGAISLFLGFEPASFEGRPVRGLYYYLHTYFPGFNGIRKVSRQALMVQLTLTVLAGVGAGNFLSWLQVRWQRWSAFGLLLCGLVWELRCFPYPMHEVWSLRSLPGAYHFVRQLPTSDLIAAVPQDDGVRWFRGDDGMAYQNYLSLHHKHRFVHGQSSWMPQVNELARRAARALPAPEATAAFEMLGVKHMVVHGSDLPPARRHLLEQLSANAEHYAVEFTEGDDRVFGLRQALPELGRFLPTPPLPVGAVLVPQGLLRAVSPFERSRLDGAVDGRLDTHWSIRRQQRAGQYLELRWDRPRPIVALEIENPGHEFHLPPAFEVLASGPEGARVVVARREPRLYREQVHTPKTFRFRVVFPEPFVADSLRLTVLSGLPGYDLVVHEIRLFEKP